MNRLVHKMSRTGSQTKSEEDSAVEHFMQKHLKRVIHAQLTDDTGRDDEMNKCDATNVTESIETILTKPHAKGPETRSTVLMLNRHSVSSRCAATMNSLMMGRSGLGIRGR